MAGYLGFDATDSKPFIFISYNTEDQGRISRITKILREYNVNIWYDNGIHKTSEKEWHEQIAIHIREAEIVFFFITKMLFEKDDSFVKKEYDLAAQHAKKICVVLLDEIESRHIPPKYDFWWVNIRNRQCIEANGLSDASVADEIYKECCRAGIINPGAQQSPDQQSPDQQFTWQIQQSSQKESKSGSGSQRNHSKTKPVMILAAAFIVIACIAGFLIHGAMTGSDSTESEMIPDADIPVEPSDDTPAGPSDDTPVGPSDDTPVEPSDDTPAEPSDDTPSTEAPAPEEEVYSPYEDVVLPQSVPDQYYFYNDHTYAFYDASRYVFTSYEQVADFCREQGGHLAVINDAAENTYLFNLLRDVSNITAFFGFSDEDNEGDWQWSDGDSSYTNWTRFGDWDLPDNGEEWGGDEDYAEFNYEKGKPGIPSDGTWNDAPFMDNTTLFICEWDYDMDKAQEYKRSHGN